jgi:hypothetical protein
MPRATFSYKSKEELREMGFIALESYIRTLRRRASVLRGPARKSTERQVAVALKVLEELKARGFGAV